MFAIRGSRESGADASAPRRSRTRLAALAAVAASCAIVPMAGAGSAQAANGYFCGNGGSGTYIYLTTSQHCINPYYHTNFTALTANRPSGSGTYCVGPSSSPTSINMPYGYGCSSSNYAVWTGGAPGYAAYWVSGGWGNFYGWFNYT